MDDMHSPRHSHLAAARPGDWLEVSYTGSAQQPRRGQILEVLGTPELPHFRIRWNEESETLHYPAEGDRLIPRDALLGD